MKISAKEEYGLRVLLRIAKAGDNGITIPMLSTAEGISEPYAGKLTRMLRLAGLIQSTRGYKGGYALNQDPTQIKVGNVLRALDGSLFDEGFCDNHTGAMSFCTNSVDCSVRSLWKILQSNMDAILDRVSLAELMGSETAFGTLQKYTEAPPSFTFEAG